LGLGLFVGEVKIGEGFAHFWLKSPGPGAYLTSHVWLKFLLKTRIKSESLKPLIGFLAFLKPKL